MHQSHKMEYASVFALRVTILSIFMKLISKPANLAGSFRQTKGKRFGIQVS